MKQIFDWKRFWCNPEGRLGLDSDGFLLNPESDINIYKNTDVVGFNEIENTPCLILLGEPGIGKSITLKHEFELLVEKSKDKKFFYCNLNQFANENRLIDEIFNSKIISDWIASNDQLVVFLDSFDECLLGINVLPSILKAQFSKLAPFSTRLSLRIACRTGFWVYSLTEYFNIFFGSENVQTFELSPLRREEIEIAADQSKLNSDAFIKDIINKDIQTLAINPLTLNFLIEEFRSNGQFSLSKEKLFYSGCRILCTEPNYERELLKSSQSVSPERRLALACRIAALMIFCKKPAINFNGNKSGQRESLLTLDMISEGQETTGHETFTFTRQDIKETVINTALFSSRGDLRFGFAHVSYAEYLAAKYIANHQLDIEQIKSLITISLDYEGKIIPQLNSTVAWLNILSSNLLHYTIENDPQTLLLTDIENLSNINKKRLVNSLLIKLSKNTITDSDIGLRKQYKKLKHPTLSKQIKPYIENKSTQFLVRRVAIDIAEACNLIDLSEILLNISLNKVEDIITRKNAVHALITLADVNQRTALLPIATLPQDDDDDDELKGSALRAVWPQILTTKDVFKYLTPPKRNHFVGSYIHLFYILKTEIKPLELNDGLNWILTYTERSGEFHFEFDHLENYLIYYSWINLENSIDKSKFARVLLYRMNNYKSIFPTPPVYGERWKPFNISQNDRLLMIREILKIIPDTDLDLISFNQLISQNDFSLIFDMFVRETQNELRSKWIKLLGHFFLNKASDIDLVLSNLETSVELKAEFGKLFEVIELGSTRALELQSNWNKRMRWKDIEPIEEEKEGGLSINIGELIIQDIEDYEKTNNLNSWFQFYYDLSTTKPRESIGDIINSDVTSLPNWEIIPDLIKGKVIELSKKYLLSNHEHFQDWFGTTSFNLRTTAYAFTGYKSLILVNKYDSQFVENLEPYYWLNWSHVLLSYPESTGIIGKDKSFLDIIKCAYIKIPEEIISVLISIIDSQNTTNEAHLFVLDKVDACMDLRMQNALLFKTSDKRLKPNAQNYIFNKLLQNGNKDALKKSKRLICRNSGLMKIEIAKAFANNCDEKGWDFVISQVNEDKDFGKEFFLSFIGNHIIEIDPILNRISEEQCADLFLMLNKLFPRNEDPVIEGGHTVGARESIANFRDQILQYLISKGTEESIDALKVIKNDLPELYIDYYLVEARKSFRRINWTPLEPNELLMLANNRKSKLIKDSDDLICLIIDSLKRFEVILQGDNGLSSTLWDEQKNNKGKFQPKSESILSDVLINHFKYDLKANGISTYREVQLRKRNHTKGGKKGELIDIYVAYVNPETTDQLVVIIEVKGSWNEGVKIDIEKQLTDRYLKKGNCVHGIYLVGWYNCIEYENQVNNTGTDDIEKAREYFRNESARLSKDGKIIKSFVLNCALTN